MPASRSLRKLALFQKRIDGDDALLELARRRFQEAGLGAEYYAASLEELDFLLRFQPRSDTSVVAHLPREIDLFVKEDRQKLLAFAIEFKARVYGLVVHDQMAIRDRLEEYKGALVEIDAALQAVKGAPMLFIEYASGLVPGFFYELIEDIQELQRISACVDIGHIGIWQARESYSRSHPDEDICSLDPSAPGFPQLLEDVQAAVKTSLPAVLQLIMRLAALGKPLHFHLHDGHPLSRSSPFGVSDHLSFFAEVPIPFQFKRRRSLAPMFGPAGLKKIVTGICTALEPDCFSLSLEIHPTAERLPLGDVAHLFSHWQDKTNAERMNHWLAVLCSNLRLIEQVPALQRWL